MDFIKPLIPQDLRDGLREALYPDEQGKRIDLIENETSHHFDEKLSGDKKTATPIAEQRNRAIARAPRIVRELYDSDLLGINEAVKLGPRVNKRKPTPEQIEAKVRIPMIELCGKQRKYCLIALYFGMLRSSLYAEYNLLR